MQNMNTVPVVGTFLDVASSANNNFLALKNAIDQLEGATYRAKGYFSSSSALSSKWPSPKVGDWAVVQSGNDAYIYQCTTNGTWTNSNVVWNGYDPSVIQCMIDAEKGRVWY